MSGKGMCTTPGIRQLLHDYCLGLLEEADEFKQHGSYALQLEAEAAPHGHVLLDGL